MTRMHKRAAANREIATKYQGLQTIEEAVKAIKSFRGPKFDQTVANAKAVLPHR